MSNLDEALKLVNNVINIDKDRKLYTEHYTALKNAILKELKKDNVFKALYHGDNLEGSYRENLKVTKPNEFDLVIYLKLPENKRADILVDPVRPDWVFIRLTNILKTIQPQKQHQQIYLKLKAWVNKKDYLLVDKLQSFLQGCMSKALTALNNEFTFEKKSTQIQFRRCGPALTIYVKHPEYSVDFVPGIYFSSTQALKPEIRKQWTAIPKPLTTVARDQISFRTNYYEDEQSLMKNGYNLKNTIRMFKKFRDRNQCMHSLKSFHIKTLFLIKFKEDTNYFKCHSSGTILLDMLKLLKETLQNENLSHFWYPRVNVYKDLHKSLLQNMCGFVSTTLSILTKHIKEKPSTNKIYRLFLTENEELSALGNLNL